MISSSSLLPFSLSSITPPLFTVAPTRSKEERHVSFEGFFDQGRGKSLSDRFPNPLPERVDGEGGRGWKRKRVESTRDPPQLTNFHDTPLITSHRSYEPKSGVLKKLGVLKASLKKWTVVIPEVGGGGGEVESPVKGGGAHFFAMPIPPSLRRAHDPRPPRVRGGHWTDREGEM